MDINSQKTTTVSIASLLTAAAVLVTAYSLLTTTRGGVAYAQEEGFTLDVAIDSVSWDPRTKQVTVDFTVTCSDEFADGSWFVEVEQSRGGKVISGNQFGFGELGCSVEGAHESATIEASNGFFRGGAALVSVAGVACTEFECDDDFAEEEVRLSPQG